MCRTKWLENGAELFAWLEQGSYFFVCGDAYRMAKDVDKALHDVIAKRASCRNNRPSTTSIN
jgi:sulfite reductase alpha subunit-like flavoprotein